MKIIPNPESYTLSFQDEVRANVWIHIEDETYYPPNGISEAIVKLLKGWLEKIERLRNLDLPKEALRFVDSPYRIEILRTERRDALRLRFLEPELDESFAELELNSTVLLNIVLDAAYEVIQDCRMRQLNSYELANLFETTTRVGREVGYIPPNSAM